MTDIYDYLRSPLDACKEGYENSYAASLAYCFTLPILWIALLKNHIFFLKGQIIGDLFGLFLFISYIATFPISIFIVAFIHMKIISIRLLS